MERLGAGGLDQPIHHFAAQPTTANSSSNRRLPNQTIWTVDPSTICKPYGISLEDLMDQMSTEKVQKVCKKSSLSFTTDQCSLD